MADEWLGHSRGGRTSKVHACADGKLRPLSLLVTAGQRNDAAWLEQVLDEIRVPRLGSGRPRKRPSRLRLDRAYSYKKQRQALRRRGISCISPEREDAKKHRLPRALKVDAHLFATFKRIRDATSSNVVSTVLKTSEP